MKKMFLTTISLLMSFIGANAQNSHWTFDENQWPDETVLFCTLVSETTAPTFSPSDFDVAAFIDNEVRALGVHKSSNNGVYLEVRVKGNLSTDNGKSITFKAYNRSTQIEYDLTLKESPLPITFDGETKDPGIPSNMRKLYISEITDIFLPDNITVTKGQTVNLLDYINVMPTGATIPNNLTWDFHNSSSYINVENNQLTGLAVTSGTYLGLGAGTLSAWTNVVVTNPATAITIKNEYKEITVNKGDMQTLTTALKDAYTLTPADATDPVAWAIADPTIVENTGKGYMPIKGGTTTMTAQIMDVTGSVRLSATLTVHVVVPVSDLTLDFNYNILDCNVGDDLTSYLNSIVKISPDDATDPTFTWSVVKRQNDPTDYVTIDGNGNIKANESGYITLKVTSNDNPNATATINVRVNNAAKDVQFAEEIVYVDGFNGQDIDISQLLYNNINFLPADFIEFSLGDLMVSSSNPSVVVVDGHEDAGSLLIEEGLAKSVGEATITVSFSYTNWLGTYTNPNGNNTVKISKSFKVVVNPDKSVQKFDISANVVFGKSGTITITPTPADAIYDANDVTLEFMESKATAFGCPDKWLQFDVTDFADAGNGKTDFTVEAKKPGTYVVTVYLNNESKGQKEISVPAPFDLVDGWQWKSLYYGNVPADEMETAFGGDKLVEVRSQTQLLYNDPTYGYFGEIAQNGVSQNVCYKVKMAGTADSYLLYGGNQSINPTAVSLNAGWTWIPNPYIYRRTLSRMQTNGLSDGDRIVSKDNGFAEFDGTKWTGSLTMLEPGQGYLFYTENGKQISYANEFSFDPADDNSGVTPAPRMGVSPWQYDAALFRDNMSIVAVVENTADLIGGYSVGAFVGDECRGEGVLVDGKLFITVHGQAGEQVSFRIHSNGELFNVGETLPFSHATGSLKAPMKLTKKGEVTGISTLNSIDETAGKAIFNASGMQQQQLRHGMNIVRQADGTVRKVLVK